MRGPAASRAANNSSGCALDFLRVGDLRAGVNDLDIADFVVQRKAQFGAVEILAAQGPGAGFAFVVGRIRHFAELVIAQVNFPFRRKLPAHVQIIAVGLVAGI